MSAAQPTRMPPASIAREAPWIVGLAGVVVGLVAEHAGGSWLQPAWIPILDLGIGWLMIGCGLAGAVARPGQPAGGRLVTAGFLWFIGTVMGSDAQPWRSIGFAFGGYHNLVLAGLALSFPDRWPTGRLARGSLAIAALLFAAQTIVRLVLTAPDTVGVTLVDPTTAESIVAWVDVLRAVSVLAIGVIIAARFVRTPAVERRYLAPVLAAGAATAIASVSNARFALTSLGFIPDIGEGAVPLEQGFNVVRILVPLAILLGVVRLRGARAAMAGAVAQVGDEPSTGTLQDALATALGDPRLRVLTWDRVGEGYRDHTGAPISTADLSDLAEDPGLMVIPVLGGEDRLAVMVLARSLGEDPTLVEAGVALTRLVIRNERQSARIQDQLADVRASRVRIVEAADIERRRIERDLHDGLQQRMVALAMQLRAADETQDQKDDALRRGSAEVLAILDDVRELARGIHPAVLSEAGLAAAIRAAADRSPVPADVDLRLSGRSAGAAEATAYYVVSEALANVAKHATGATAVWVEADDDDRRLRVVVEDDGPGHADPRGHGLAGLADRVAALDGQFRVERGPRGGTRVVAEVPIS